MSHFPRAVLLYLENCPDLKCPVTNIQAVCKDFEMGQGEP